MDPKSDNGIVNITVGCSNVCAEAGHQAGSNAEIRVSTIQEAVALILRSSVRKNFSLWNSELCKIALELCLAKPDKATTSWTVPQDELLSLLQCIIYGGNTECNVTFRGDAETFENTKMFCNAKLLCDITHECQPMGSSIICLIHSRKFHSENDERLLKILERFCSVQRSLPNPEQECPELKSLSLHCDAEFDHSLPASNPKTPSVEDVHKLRVQLLANYVVLSYLTLLFNSYDILACARALCVTNFDAFVALRRAFQTSKLSPYQIVVSFVRRIRLGGNYERKPYEKELEQHQKCYCEFVDVMQKLQNTIEEEYCNERSCFESLLRVIKRRVWEEITGKSFRKALDECNRSLIATWDRIAKNQPAIQRLIECCATGCVEVASSKKCHVVGESFIRMLQRVVDARICALDSGSVESMKHTELWLHDMESSPNSENSQRIPSIFTVYKSPESAETVLPQKCKPSECASKHMLKEAVGSEPEYRSCLTWMRSPNVTEKFQRALVEKQRNIAQNVQVGFLNNASPSPIAIDAKEVSTKNLSTPLAAVSAGEPVISEAASKQTPKRKMARSKLKRKLCDENNVASGKAVKLLANADGQSKLTKFFSTTIR